MQRKLMAAIVLSVLAIGLLAPLAADGSDAIDDGAYSISLSEGDISKGPVDVTVGNGKTASWNLYVVNHSDKYLKISYTKESDSKVSVIELPEAKMIGPSGSTDPSNSTTGKISISVDEYAGDTDTFVATVHVLVTNVDDEDDYAENDIVFNVTVDSSFDTSGVYNKFLGFIDNKLPSPFNSPIFTMVVSIIVWFVIFTVICGLIIPFLGRYVGEKNEDEATKKSRHRTLMRLLMPLIFLLALNQGLKIAGASNELISLVSSISLVVYVILASFIVWKVYVLIVSVLLRRVSDISEDDPIDMSLLPLFKMIGRIIIAVVAVSVILATFGVNLEGILVSAGVVSLGITMGAQNVLSQFFSGLVILTSRPFQAGDFLKINDKVYIVKRVKLMYTEFTSWENDQVITMPNNVVSSATIHNMTKNDLPVKQYVYFTVAYGTDMEKAKDIMIDVASKNPLVVMDNDHEGPSFRMTDLLDSGVELRLSYYARTFDDTGGSAGQIRMDVYKAFMENGIEIPYNRLQVDVLSEPAGKKKDSDLSDD